MNLLKTMFFVFFFLLSAVHVASSQFSEAGVDKFRVAVEAPEFTFKELGGGERSHKAMRGKIVILNFFATW